MIATSAAKTGVNGKLAAWAFIILLANNPLPWMKSSEKSSGTIRLILVMFTRLIVPVIDLHKAYQESRWYSTLILSIDAGSCMLRVCIQEFWEFDDCCDSSFQVLIVPASGVLSRPRPDIVCIRKWKVVHRLLMIGLGTVTCSKKN